MIMASWGPMYWIVSSDELRALEKIERSVELDLDSGDDKEGSSATNNKGLKTETLNLTFATSYVVGTDTRAEFDAWKSLIGQYAPFYLAGELFSPAQMQLTSVKLTKGTLDPDGHILTGQISIVLTEYGAEASELKPTPAASVDYSLIGLEEDTQTDSAAGITADASYKKQKVSEIYA